MCPDLEAHEPDQCDWTTPVISEAPTHSRDDQPVWTRVDAGTDGAPESRLCPCQLWDPGPVTHPQSLCLHVSGDKDSATYRDCCPCCPQKLGFVIKPCLTWRHSGYNKQNELSYPYSEMWNSDVVFILHQCRPIRKMF